MELDRIIMVSGDCPKYVYIIITLLIISLQIIIQTYELPFLTLELNTFMNNLNLKVRKNFSSEAFDCITQ